MSSLNQSAPLPEKTIREFEEAYAFDWKKGVPLSLLLARVNRIAESFLPAHGGPGSGAGRVKQLFTERAFRHYQTHGCIDVPEKEGRRAYYGPRHFVQALLVRRLLWERVSADRIVGLVARRSTDEIQGMFLYGVEFVARTGDSNPADAQAPASLRSSIRRVEKWNRVQIAPGVELHLSSGLPQFKPKELQRLLELLEQALREVVC